MSLSPVEIAAAITAVGVVTSAIIAWVGQRPRQNLDRDQAVFTRLESMVRVLGNRVDTLEEENRKLRERVRHLERELQQHGIALPPHPGETDHRPGV